MDWPIGLDDVEFVDAISFFMRKVPVTPDVWRKLYPDVRARAFTVSAVAQLDVVTDVWRAIDRAIANGTTFADFAKEVKGPLTAAWGGTVKRPAQRIETIFRTNVQGAYAAGRHAQLTDPDVLDDRPYWQYDAILDNRTSPVCKAAHGTVLAADDKWWATHNPPCHFNCRSTVIALTPEEATAQGITKKPTTEQAGKGFGAPPDLGEDDWVADKLANAPEELAAITRQNLEGAASFPREKWAPNPPGTPPRTIQEALQIAEDAGVSIDPALIRISIAERGPGGRPWPDNVHAYYLYRAVETMAFVASRTEFTDRFGRYRVNLNPSVLESDEAICGVLAHEAHEIQALEAYLDANGGQISGRALDLLTNIEDGLAHCEAWDHADKVVRERREREIKKGSR